MEAFFGKEYRPWMARARFSGERIFSEAEDVAKVNELPERWDDYSTRRPTSKLN
jgi:hypothetical protein